MKRTVLLFGILAGGIIIAYSYIVFLILGDFASMTPQDLAMAQWLGYIRYLVLLLGVVMAMVAYKRERTGPISYGQALKVGVLVALVTAFFVGAMECIYIAMNPDFYEQYGRLVAEGMQADGATAAELEKMRQQQQEYAWMANPLATGLFYFVETSVIGTILAVLAAFFIQRKKSISPMDHQTPILDRTI